MTAPRSAALAQQPGRTARIRVGSAPDSHGYIGSCGLRSPEIGAPATGTSTKEIRA